MSTMTAEMQALKERLRATWMSGDYADFARYMEAGALEFLDRMALAPGTRLLDVGCGAGQIAIPAARAGVRITGVDIAENLIEHARGRAATEGLTASFDVGDAEALPYPDGQFDVVVSLIGAMFAPRPERVAAELIRVARPGGRIVMANWTPAGHVGQMFKIIGKYVPPPPLMPSPMLWGDEEVARERLREGTGQVQAVRRLYPMQYPFGPAEVVELFLSKYGPTVRAMAVLDDAGKADLRGELTQLWTGANTATDNTTRVPAEYLEISAIRKAA